MQIRKITQILETIAPSCYQENYDNSGLLVGSPDDTVTGALITLDVTEEVIDEAIAQDCNLIIAHHPLIFKGLKRLNGKHWVEKCVIKAIKNDIAIYAIHTNLDHVEGGVNSKIAEMIGLEQTSILAPKTNLLNKLTTFSPQKNTEAILNALYEAGAGQIGKYDQCSFRSEGTGTFRPGADTNAFIGEVGKQESVSEDRIEVIFLSHLSRKILSALKKAHPYEEVAYYLQSLENENQEVGAGMIGMLPEKVETNAFLQSIKTKMKVEMIRHTAIHQPYVQKIAVCGGSGSFLLSKAKSLSADVFITADFKYHEFFEAENQIIIADIGHFESEQFTKDLLFDILSEKLTNIAVRLSKAQTNPIKYL